MTNAKTVRSAVEEIDYRYVESQFNDVPMATAVPCQLRFTEPPDQDTERFHEALERRGIRSLGGNPARKSTEDKPHYDGEVCFEDYERVRVLVFRNNTVRLYPRSDSDDSPPSEEKMANLIDALEDGFAAPLEHSPINQDER